jgi:hypothetical protein
VSCQGEACHGAAVGAPSVVGAGTVAFSGPGNLAPPATPVVKAKAKAKKHKTKAKPKKKPKKRRPKGRAGRSSKAHGHTSRAGGK